MVCFFEFFIPSTLGGHNFLNFISFLTIFNAPNALIGMFKVFLDIKNNKAFPLDPACLECSNVYSLIGLSYNYNSIATKKQLKI
jgi:hypothetical protein